MLFSKIYIDVITILIFAFFLHEALKHGFFTILADFLSFLFSLALAFRYYREVSNFFVSSFNMTHSFARAIGFLLTAIISEFVLGYLLGVLVFHIHRKFKGSVYIRFLGIIPAFGEASLFIIFLLTIIFSFPVNPKIKEDIENSHIASRYIPYTTSLERQVNDVFGGVIEDTISYFTVKPESNERIPLNYPVKTLTVDSVSEQGMFNKVNEERNKLALKAYIWDEKLATIAREYAKKMWQEKFFGHVDSDGKDIGDRLQAAGVNYLVAGENLALAPTLNIAHTGLMNSEGHRKNILDSEYNKVGIGVIDNGVYGKIFVQVFVK